TAGSRNASSSVAARSPVCVPTQAACVTDEAATSASRLAKQCWIIPVFLRITARSLRAHPGSRSALFYRLWLLCGDTASKRHGVIAEGRALRHIHCHEHAQ